MDGHGNVNMRSWSFIESSPTALKGHLGLQLMSSIVDKKPLIHGASGGSIRGHQQAEQNRHHHHQQHPLQHQNHYGYPSLVATSINGGLFHHHHLWGGITESSVGFEYMRGSWLSYNKEQNLNLLLNNDHHYANYGEFAESSSAHSLQMLLSSSLKTESEASHPQLQESCEERDFDVGIVRNRGAPKLHPDKLSRAKKAKTAPIAQKNAPALSVPRLRAPKKSVELVINGISMDISGIPIPVCTCTGSPQQCCSGVQAGGSLLAAIIFLSTYPLPMNSKRHGVRIAGRKRVLERLRRFWRNLLLKVLISLTQSILEVIGQSMVQISLSLSGSDLMEIVLLNL